MWFFHHENSNFEIIVVDSGELRNDKLKNFNPEIYIYDKNEQLSTHSLSETINCADLIFISGANTSG